MTGEMCLALSLNIKIAVVSLGNLHTMVHVDHEMRPCFHFMNPWPRLVVTALSRGLISIMVRTLLVVSA